VEVFILCEEHWQEVRASGGCDVVTTPSEIIPYYRLNHSIWSLSDDKESSR
jgi:hypothetical protein